MGNCISPVHFEFLGKNLGFQGKKKTRKKGIKIGNTVQLLPIPSPQHGPVFQNHGTESVPPHLTPIFKSTKSVDMETFTSPQDWPWPFS